MIGMIVLAAVQAMPAREWLAVQAWKQPTEARGVLTWRSEPLRPSIEWNEAVPSWTIDAPGGSIATVYLVPANGKRYCLGRWTSDRALAPRASVADQKAGGFEVQTDTLARADASKDPITVEIDMRPNAAGQWPRVKNFSLALSNGVATAQPLPSQRPAVWGTTIDVPKRSQMSYPGGNVLCSPTSVSMLLCYWSQSLSRPELDADVPIVQQGVFDAVWNGTGNWAFNMAFAANRPGLRAYVSRFRGIDDLEAWVGAGVPVATSVSYGLLKGKGKVEPNDGHLVVCVGFTESGDPVFNDPGRSSEVRQIYKRDDFQAAWGHSGNTVYLVYPRTWLIPRGDLGAPWDTRLPGPRS